MKRLAVIVLVVLMGCATISPGLKMIDKRAYLLVTAMDSQPVRDFFDITYELDIHKVVIEIHSQGGPLFEAQRIVNLMQYWQSKGVTIETRVYGMALSAGFYIFVAGDRRLVSRDADLMWHTIQGVGDDAILKHLQGIRHRYLASRGNLTVEELDEMVANRDIWMSGKDAVKYGFADGYL